MQIISDAALLEYSQQGWVPGPDENEENFLDRIQSLQNKQLFTEDYRVIPAEQRLTALEKIKEIYHICPYWVEMFYSNRKLAPWHGGVAEILYNEKGRLSGAYLQLHRSFQNPHSLLSRLYSRDELLAHELAHIGRMAFEEPCFEEFFAYLTSAKRWRFWLGPLISASWEILIFFAVIVASTLMSQPLFFVALLGCAFVRLAYRHWIFWRAVSLLTQAVGSKRLALAIMYRLTDKEIRLFARMEVCEIKDFIHSHNKSTLRWRTIFLIMNSP